MMVDLGDWNRQLKLLAQAHGFSRVLDSLIKLSFVRRGRCRDATAADRSRETTDRAPRQDVDRVTGLPRPPLSADVSGPRLSKRVCFPTYSCSALPVHKKTYALAVSCHPRAVPATVLHHFTRA